MKALERENRDEYGVEPICGMLKIAFSSYYEHDARRRRPERAPSRVVRDAALKPEIERVFYENFQVYGVRKVWRQLLREGFAMLAAMIVSPWLIGTIGGILLGEMHKDRKD